MFIFSVLSVLISSFFILAIINNKFDFKQNIRFILFILINFCQLILTFELLSILSAITIKGVLFANSIILITSIICWFIKGKPIFSFGIVEESKKIYKALKKDKVLFFVGICFLIFIVSMLITALFFPIRYGDALGYYLSRCTAWIQNGNFNHYITTDTRELIMPINSEITYLWVLLFLKNEIGIGIFPFIFYVNSLVVIYNFLGELNFCRRKRLWTIFVYSGLALVHIQSSIPGADLWIGSLILTSIYFFFIASKYKKMHFVYFSTLAYTLAMGTKTTSIIAIPASFLLLITISLLYNKENIKKYIGMFFAFGLINFAIFSSYNYILNFIDFKNPISDQSQLLLNQFRGGFKGFLTNLIRYSFAMFDFSGFIDKFGLGNAIESLQDKAFSLIGETKDSYASPFFGHIFKYNQAFGIADSYLGVIGFLAFFPAIIISIYKSIIKKISKKTILLASLALFYVLNIIIYSRVMLYTRFNMRYLLAFVVVASPIIVYTYIKKNPNIYKIIVTWFLFVYLAFTAHAKPFILVKSYFKHKSLPIEKQIKDHHFILADCDEFRIRDYFLSKQKGNIAIIFEQTEETPIYYIEKLRLNGFTIHTILPEIISTYDLNKYDYIIGAKPPTASTIIKNHKKGSKNLSKSYCAYKNYNRQIIEGYDETPVIVTCNFPFEYFVENGFSIEKNIHLEHYIILKK